MTNKVVLVCLIVLVLLLICVSGETLQALHQVQQWLQGSYSNIMQASRDAKANKPTAPEGGHEHVTCIIEKHPQAENTLIAQFRFGADLTTPPFRYRHYTFQPSTQDPQRYCYMKLYKPKQNTLDRLKRAQYSSRQYVPNTLQECDELVGCDIHWTLQTPFFGLFPSYFLGKLVNGVCRLPSQSNPQEMITVKDELKLWGGRLWINDRVYSSTGKLVIGNRDGIPYKFDKQP